MVQLIKLPWTEIPRLGMRSAVNCREPQYSDKLALSPRASELFGLYFDDEVLEIMVLETNRYEKQINRKKWQDIAKDKLKALLGIILVMGVIPSHHLSLLEQRPILQRSRDLQRNALQEIPDHKEHLKHP